MATETESKEQELAEVPATVQTFRGKFQPKASLFYNLSKEQSVSGGMVCMAVHPTRAELVVAMTSTSCLVTIDTTTRKQTSKMTCGGPSPEGPGPLTFMPDGSLAMFVNNEFKRLARSDKDAWSAIPTAAIDGLTLPEALRGGPRVGSMFADAKGRILVNAEPNQWILLGGEEKEGGVATPAGPGPVSEPEEEGHDVRTDNPLALPDGSIVLQNMDSLQVCVVAPDGRVEDITPTDGYSMDAQLCPHPSNGIVMVGTDMNADEDIAKAEVTFLRKGQSPVTTKLDGLPDFDEIETLCVDPKTGVVYVSIVLNWPDDRAVYAIHPESLN